ncbi:MAG: hypothetical protein ACO1SX_23765 [Actinomycetota bacterium]
MRSCRRKFCSGVASGLAGALLPDTVGLSAPASRITAGVDSARDPRLVRRVRLRSEGMPVSRVLRKLSAATGVTLDAPGRTGDERLAAYVPGSTLAEIMTAIAELLRLDWLRTGADQPSYRLFKPLATVREEAQLRDRSMQGMLAQLEQVTRNGPVGTGARVRLGQEELAAALPDVLPLIVANGTLLLQEGYVYVPLARLAGPLQQRLTARLQPVIDQHNAISRRIQSDLNERRAAEGKSQISIGGANGPPPRAGQCLLMGEIRLQDTPAIWVGMRDPNFGQYVFMSAEGDDLVLAGRSLYPGRSVSPRVDGAAEAARAHGPLLDSVVDVPLGADLPPTDWMTRLRMLSNAAGLPIYTDLYSDFGNGRDGHARGRLTLAARTSPAAALDALCRSRKAGSGDQPASFWWAAGGAAFVRSSRWLWASQSTLPADLVERLARAVQVARHVDPADLPGLARLSGFQVQGNGFAMGQLDAWTHAVRAPARLTHQSREQLVTRGLEWSALSAPEQQLLLGLLAPQGGVVHPRYSAALRARPEHAPSQGGTLLQTEVEAAWGASRSSAGLQLPLPGFTRSGLPDPQALEVERL